mmetsp:Transcript_16753/g.45984  ORF Transcript_16753/g.45984 Transcript_16753/m.45984 type:complete len:334 (+) Transcript_16753:404-1405(+)
MELGELDVVGDLEDPSLGLFFAQLFQQKVDHLGRDPAVPVVVVVVIIVVIIIVVVVAVVSGMARKDPQQPLLVNDPHRLKEAQQKGPGLRHGHRVSQELAVDAPVSADQHGTTAQGHKQMFVGGRLGGKLGPQQRKGNRSALSHQRDQFFDNLGEAELVGGVGVVISIGFGSGSGSATATATAAVSAKIVPGRQIIKRVEVFGVGRRARNVGGLALRPQAVEIEQVLAPVFERTGHPGHQQVGLEGFLVVDLQRVPALGVLAGLFVSVARLAGEFLPLGFFFLKANRLAALVGRGSRLFLSLEFLLRRSGRGRHGLVDVRKAGSHLRHAVERD